MTWDELVQNAKLRAARELANASAQGARCPSCGATQGQTSMTPDSGRAMCPGHGSYMIGGLTADSKTISD